MNDRPMTSPRLPFLILVCLALTAGLHACGASGAGTSGGEVTAGAAQAGRPQAARVDRVIDGDTLKVRLADGRLRTVRILGIDTPETKKPDTPVECGGEQASAAMRSLALSGSGYGARGREVQLISDPTGDQVDRFGRTLAYVEADGLDLGGRQVADGWAKVYAYQGRQFRRRARYEQSARAARDAGRGVYGACAGNFHSSR
jgi:micrococcal nuclease